MQIDIVSGIYADTGPDIRTQYPINMYVVPKGSGISASYLRPADGVIDFCSGPGVDRGGIVWNDVMYRAMGTKLVSISRSGAITTIGDIGGSGKVRFDYSFKYLAVNSDNKLYLYDGTTLQYITDSDILNVVDFVWVDGYFMTTDGSYLIVTELNDPLSVNPLKYGSSELDPDPIQALLKIRNEIYSVNRYTIEVFANVGGELFPFERILGAQIQKGVISTHACCIYNEALAFVGSGKNEPIGIYIGFNGQVQKISTDDIDRLLSALSESDLKTITVEARAKNSNKFLYVHLPTQTLVYDIAASAAIGAQAWHILKSDNTGYRMRHFTYAYNRWYAGDTRSSKIGEIKDTLSGHYAVEIPWSFSTAIQYADGAKAICHELELVALTGRVDLGVNPYIGLSYSDDGLNWSQVRTISAGIQGQFNKRLVWRRLGAFKHWRTFRFTGTSAGHSSFIRLDGKFEVLK